MFFLCDLCVSFSSTRVLSPPPFPGAFLGRADASRHNNAATQEEEGGRGGGNGEKVEEEEEEMVN